MSDYLHDLKNRYKSELQQHHEETQEHLMGQKKELLKQEMSDRATLEYFDAIEASLANQEEADIQDMEAYDSRNGTNNAAKMRSHQRRMSQAFTDGFNQAMQS